MGRPKKPIEQHKAQGSFRPDRHGPDRSAMKADGRPVKPRGLSKAESWAWRFIVNDLDRLTVARRLDTPALTALCVWWARYTENAAELAKHLPTDPAYYRLLIQMQMCWKTFDALASKFGLSPSDRTRIRLEDGIQYVPETPERKQPKRPLGI